MLIKNLLKESDISHMYKVAEKTYETWARIDYINTLRVHVMNFVIDTYKNACLGETEFLYSFSSPCIGNGSKETLEYIKDRMNTEFKYELALYYYYLVHTSPIHCHELDYVYRDEHPLKECFWEEIIPIFLNDEHLQAVEEIMGLSNKNIRQISSKLSESLIKTHDPYKTMILWEKELEPKLLNKYLKHDWAMAILYAWDLCDKNYANAQKTKSKIKIRNEWGPYIIKFMKLAEELFAK